MTLATLGICQRSHVLSGSRLGVSIRCGSDKKTSITPCNVGAIHRRHCWRPHWRSVVAPFADLSAPTGHVGSRPLLRHSLVGKLCRQPNRKHLANTRSTSPALIEPAAGESRSIAWGAVVLRRPATAMIRPQRCSGPGNSLGPTSTTWSVACRLFCLRAQFRRTNSNPSRYELGSG